MQCNVMFQCFGPANPLSRFKSPQGDRILFTISSNLIASSKFKNIQNPEDL